MRIIAAILLLSSFSFAQGGGGKVGFGGKAGFGGGNAIAYTVTTSASWTCTNAGAGASCSTSAVTVTAGASLQAVGFGCGDAGCGTTPSSQVAISDNCGDTFIAPSGASVLNSKGAVQLAYVLSAVGGSCAFTATITGGTPFYVQGGVNQTTGITSVDTPTANNATNTTANPTITTAAGVALSSEFIFGGVIANAAATPSGTSIIAFNASKDNTQWTSGTASGTQTLNWTATAGQWDAVILAFH